MTSITTINGCPPRSKLDREFSHAFCESASIRISAFQRIGRLLGLVSGPISHESSDKQLNETFAIDYLHEFEGFDFHTSVSLVSGETHPRELFETIWEHISDYDKAVALWLDYDVSCNYWPGWNIYARTLLPYITLTSGTPEQIIGAPPESTSRLLKSRKSRGTVISMKVKELEAFDDEEYSLVLAEHNFVESSCTRQYFPIIQQVFVILDLFDDAPGDEISWTDAVYLFRKLNLPNELVASLLNEHRWSIRFEKIWGWMSDRLRIEFLAEDWDMYDNYWPGFNFYNQTLKGYIDLLPNAPVLPMSGEKILLSQQSTCHNI